MAHKPAHRKHGYFENDLVLGAIVAFDNWLMGKLTRSKPEISYTFTPREEKERKVRFR